MENKTPQKQGQSRGNKPQRNSNENPSNNFSRIIKSASGWVLLIVVALILYQFFDKKTGNQKEIAYSEFMTYISNGSIRYVMISDLEVIGSDSDLSGKSSSKEGGEEKVVFKAYLPSTEIMPNFLERLEAKDVQIESKPSEGGWLSNILIYWGPLLILAVVWIFLFRQMQGGGGRGIFSFGKSRAKLFTGDQPKVDFDDVAGADEAKNELVEIIEFLKSPGKFQKLGGRIPKGVLLLGPPGVGKTLLAKAVAGEAEVPFFSTSGSDFLEMFVGVGASRVRDLFEQGQKNSPAIIFIDELDAVGRHRGAGLGGGHDEREQTLNQLLTEMDGFEPNAGVIVLAATNRPDVLDPALLRPGRFDRQIVVERPDVRGREGIFKVHTKKTPLAEDVDLETLAKGTPGFSGAEIENMVNEAALLAARRTHDKLMMKDFEDAKDKVIMGLERKSMILTDDQKKTTAYHEAGHVLVGKMLPNTDPIHKVTIIPRGWSLGATHYLPLDERKNYSRAYLNDMLAGMLGGRAAEFIVLGQRTSGASNDISRATDLARRMVCEWGMTETLGPLTFGKKEEEIFLGKEISRHKDYSEATAIEIDREIRKIIDDAHDTATKILKENEHLLHKLANELLDKETLNSDEIDKILEQSNEQPKEKTVQKNEILSNN